MVRRDGFAQMPFRGVTSPACGRGRALRPGKRGTFSGLGQSDLLLRRFFCAKPGAISDLLARIRSFRFNVTILNYGIRACLVRGDVMPRVGRLQIWVAALGESKDDPLATLAPL